MSTPCTSHEQIREADDDRPSFERVEGFLASIEQRRDAARRNRWVGMGVGVAIAGVAFLTAIGHVSVPAEGLVVSASAVVAGLALGKN